MAEMTPAGSPQEASVWLLDKLRQLESLDAQVRQSGGRETLLPLVFSILGAVEAMEVCGTIDGFTAAGARSRLEALGLQTQTVVRGFHSNASTAADFSAVAVIPDWSWNNGVHRLGMGVVAQGIAAESWPDVIRVTGRLIDYGASGRDESLDLNQVSQLSVNIRTTTDVQWGAPVTAVSHANRWWIHAIAVLPAGQPRVRVVGLDFLSPGGSIHVWLGRQPGDDVGH